MNPKETKVEAHPMNQELFQVTHLHLVEEIGKKTEDKVATVQVNLHHQAHHLQHLNSFQRVEVIIVIDKIGGREKLNIINNMITIARVKDGPIIKTIKEIAMILEIIIVETGEDQVADIILRIVIQDIL